MSKEKIIENYKIGKNGIIASIIYSILVAITIVFQSKIKFSGVCQDGYIDNQFGNFYWSDILIGIGTAILVFILVINIIALYNSKKIKIFNKIDEELTKKSKIAFLLITILLMLIPYIIYFLTYYPGFVHQDSLNSIYQALGRVRYYNHHPVAYTFFIGIFMKLGLKISPDYNLGYAFYTITQIIIIVSALSYFLLWLKKHNVKMIYIILTFLFFAFNSCNLAIAITMWKDSLFSIYLFLMTLYLYDIIEQDGRQLKKPGGIIKFIVLNFLIAFWRTNGVFVVIAEALILLIVFRTRFRIFKILNVISVIIILLIQGPLYKHLEIVSPAEEKLGMLVQQVGRTIVYDGNITDEQKVFLNKLLNLETWKQIYRPCTVDLTKWHGDFDKGFLNNNQKEFIKVWAQILKNNKVEYLKAYLMETCGFWAFGLKGDNYGAPLYFYQSNDYGLERTDLIKETTGVSIEKLYKEKTSFISVGTLIWFVFLVVVILITQKKSKYILSLTPLIFCWISVIISTPIAVCLRYMYIMVYGLPFIIMLPFLIRREED